MFRQPYEYKYKMHEHFSEGEYNCCRYVFTFRDFRNQVFVIHVEEYPEKVFVIKFHQKSHKNAKNKWRIMTKAGDASRKIATCLDILIKEFYAKNPFASFGFYAANGPDEKKANTKRYRLYQKVMAGFFNPRTFKHFEDRKNSCYLLCNKIQLEKDPEYIFRIEKVFKDIFDFE